jgi:hypothetical protein
MATPVKSSRDKILARAIPVKASRDKEIPTRTIQVKPSLAREIRAKEIPARITRRTAKKRKRVPIFDRDSLSIKAAPPGNLGGSGVSWEASPARADFFFAVGNGAWGTPLYSAPYVIQSILQAGRKRP